MIKFNLVVERLKTRMFRLRIKLKILMDTNNKSRFEYVGVKSMKP